MRFQNLGGFFRAIAFSPVEGQYVLPAYPADSGSQKVQREGENLYFHTSVTFEQRMGYLKTHRQSIGGQPPVISYLRLTRLLHGFTAVKLCETPCETL